MERKRERSAKELLEAERMSELIAVSFDGRESDGKNLLGISLSTLENWVKRRHDPPRNKYPYLISRMGLRSDVLTLSPEDWSEYLNSVPAIVASKLPGGVPEWIYSGGQLQILEKYIGRGDQVILITENASNDTEIPEVFEMVRNNVQSGANYLYVVPADCDHLEELRELVASFWTEFRDQPGVGSVSIMCVQNQPTDLEWRFIDHILMIIRDTRIDSSEAFSSLLVPQIDRCFEQVYRPGDEASTGNRIWLETPGRKKRLLLDLLRRWSSAAEWEGLGTG
jgi:hypothetical protein